MLNVIKYLIKKLSIIIVFNCYGLSYNTKKLIEYRGITNYKYISRSNNDTVIGPINEEDE